MKFNILLEDLLNELSGEEIYQKYYSKIPYQEFIAIVSADPQSVVENSKVTRMGKYSKLLLSMYQKGGLLIEDLESATEYLEYVYKHNISVDLNKIKLLSDLYELVKTYIIKDKKDLGEILQSLSKSDYKVLHNGENWYIFQPLSEKGACYLGVSTNWCTTWGPLSLNKKYRDRSNQFKSYSIRGPLFIMINKNDNEDKYQFSFEHRQYMDKTDRPIDTKKFFKDPNKKELLYYFFPSFIKDVDSQQLENEVSRIKILPNDLSLILIKKTIGKTNNKLVRSILDNDIDAVYDMIPFIKEIEVNDSMFEFEMGEISTDMTDYETKLGWYDYEINNGWEHVYNDTREIYSSNSDEPNIVLIEFFESYFNKNKEWISSTTGISKLESFKNKFLKEYVSDDEIYRSLCSSIADLSASNYEEENEKYVSEMREDINISQNYYRDTYTISLNMSKFMIFLVSGKIDKINDNEDLCHIIDRFIRYCGHHTDFEPIYDFELVDPKYGDDSTLTKKTDDFFENILSDISSYNDCSELVNKFNQIYSKYFKNKQTYENDHFIVTLKSLDVDCENESVRVTYLNKDTKQKFGFDDKNDSVKVENLVSLLTNHKLFESLIKFKKNII